MNEFSKGLSFYRDRLGLEFHYMIDEQEVLVHITRRTQPKQEGFRRPGIR